jgi:hypothetical protein
MADDAALPHHQVVAMGVKFGAKDLHVDDVVTPQQAERIANERVFDDSLSQCRV